jgi:glycosyltransferase involved in cell wall biosynthesis
LNRSPAELLKEIILVDDSSSSGEGGKAALLSVTVVVIVSSVIFIVDMQQRLDDYVASNLPKVRVLRLLPPRPHSRKGLMAARSLGAQNATGEVLLFLDSNLEANVNWLPPLLGESNTLHFDTRASSIDSIRFLFAFTYEQSQLQKITKHAFARGSTGPTIKRSECKRILMLIRALLTGN